jgi:hypothetical protein
MFNFMKMKKLTVLFLILAAPLIVFAQSNLIGNWKYVSQEGEMTMQISTNTIVINSQSFTYKTQGNVLMINEGTKTTPYPFMLDGNKLTLEFPGGTELIFTRSATGATPQGQLPQSMSRPSSGMGQGQQASTLSGRWLFQNQQGQVNLEFLSANQLSFNGEKTKYQMKEGIIQAMGDYGWIDYPYTLSQGTLTITFPDGTRLPFTRVSSTPTNQQGMNRQTSGEGSTWQLKGALCSYSGSSNSYSSYSRTQKIVFDGQGNFQFGSEASFSSDAGLAYSGNPNVKTGTYSVGESTVTLYYPDGDTYQFKINMRQNNGMITELMYSGTLYAKGLCE